MDVAVTAPAVDLEKGNADQVDEPFAQPQSTPDAGKDATKMPSVPFSSLFAFSDSADKLYILIGLVSAVGLGVALPLMTTVFGEIIDVFLRFDLGKKQVPGIVPMSAEEFDRGIVKNVAYFWYV
jgi:ATP-binding cassette subfamily B (MDR/TAP) protein 1